MLLWWRRWREKRAESDSVTPRAHTDGGIVVPEKTTPIDVSSWDKGDRSEFPLKRQEAPKHHSITESPESIVSGSVGVKHAGLYRHMQSSTFWRYGEGWLIGPYHLFPYLCGPVPVVFTSENSINVCLYCWLRYWTHFQSHLALSLLSSWTKIEVRWTCSGTLYLGGEVTIKIARGHNLLKRGNSTITSWPRDNHRVILHRNLREHIMDIDGAILMYFIVRMR